MRSKASAPGKIILFGEHFVVYGVKAILCAIDKRIAITSEKIDERKISIISNIGKLDLPIDKSITEINSPLKPLYYLANKIIKKYNSSNGIRITVESNIPPGVGLGSSSACCVAGAASIYGLFEKSTKEKILNLAIEAERTIFQNTSGADCTVCTFGGLMEYDKENGFKSIKLEPQFNLVIANSKLEHSTKEVVASVKKFKDENNEKFHDMCKKENELINQIMIFLRNNNIIDLGNSMKKNQEFLETIGISNEKLREIINIANITSYGGKITGAGGGGCIVALTDQNNLEKTMALLEEKNIECFSTKIDFRGLDTF